MAGSPDDDRSTRFGVDYDPDYPIYGESAVMQVHESRELIECAYKRSAEIGWENRDGVLMNDIAGLAEYLLDEREGE